MFSDNSLGAYLYLQECARTQTDSYALERLDRALDEVASNPLRDHPAQFQARSAMANAAKVLKSRRALAPVTSLEVRQEYRDDIGADSRCAGGPSSLEAIETVVWLTGTRAITEVQRSILMALAQGHDAASLADRQGVPIARMRERIARARAAGRRAYAGEVLHAPECSNNVLPCALTVSA
ncbi:hypothetical protein ABFT23_02005 [Nocardioides sp. C4-1]|uniref:hypothetical protein n=1 Tax=Nocardioides sp. C4-1 TaxID=3151851 RepID=UPI003264F74E